MFGGGRRDDVAGMMALVMTVLMTGVAVATMMTAMKGRRTNHGEFWEGGRGNRVA